MDNRALTAGPGGLRSLAVASYAWVTTAFFGAILLDIVYARNVPGALGQAESARGFAAAADLLLLIGGLAILAAFVAAASAWETTAARYLLLASVVLVGLEFLTPALATPFRQSIGDLGLGPWLRIIPAGLASALAFLALYKSH